MLLMLGIYSYIKGVSVWGQVGVCVWVGVGRDIGELLLISALCM